MLGAGSYTYQYNTRDTFGFATKATYVEINGEGREIFKDPITDDGTKKSKKGLLCVDLKDGKLHCFDQVAENDEHLGMLERVFCDGKLLKETNLEEIRNRLSNQ